MTYYEIAQLLALLPDGKAYKFYFLIEVKSFITQPSSGHSLEGAGLLRDFRHRLFRQRPIAKVMVSADGGKSWGEAALRRAGQRRPSRAFACRGAGTAAGGAEEPRLGRGRRRRSRCAPISSPRAAKPRKSPNVLGFPNQHYNSLTIWGIDSRGEIKHVYV